jgi:phage gp29-like protein
MAQIVDQFGRPIERSVLSEQQSDSVPWLAREIAGHPARHLTLEGVQDIFQQAEFGFLIRQHELFRDMEERSPHIHAEMHKRKRAITRLAWDVQPPRNPTAAEEKLTDFAREQLLDLSDLEDLIFDCLDAVGNGFSPLELKWARLGSTWVLEKHYWRPQSWFQNDQATRMEIHLRDGTPDGAPLLPFGWVLHQHKAVSGYTSRQPLMRVLAWPYLLEQYAVWDFAEFLDIYGMPLRVGKYPNNATPEERNTLYRAIMGIGHNAAGIIPTSMEIEFTEAMRNADAPYIAALAWCASAQSKAILGQTMSAEAHGSGLGSGNAKLHGEVRTDIRDADAKLINATITNQVIYPILALNMGFSDIRRCPRFTLDISKSEDIATWSKALPELASVMQIPTRFAHDRLRIPEPVNNEPVLKVNVADVQPMREVKTLAAASQQVPQAADIRAIDRLDPMQGQIDRALDMLAKELPGQGRDLARAALAAVSNAGDFQEALAALSADHVQTADAVLIEAIARAMFVCELLGADAVRREIANG